MTKLELMQAINNNGLIDYVANNYWKWTKEQLTAIALEALFTLDDYNIKESKININELLDKLDLDDDSDDVIMIDLGALWG